MENTSKLSLGEFIADLGFAIVSPSQRFTVIQERGAIWGSLLLLAIPFYFIFESAGGLYFDRDPFPGYAFVLPAVLAVVAALIGALLIHFVAKLFHRSGRYLAPSGTYRMLLVVLGYTSIPSLLGYFIAFLIFLLVPKQAAAVIRDFPASSISFLIGVGVALIVWHLILVLLTLRTVYPIHDSKILLSFIVGQLLAWVLFTFFYSIAYMPIRIDYRYIQPMLSEETLPFFFEDPIGIINRSGEVKLNVDFLAYRFQSPELFDFVLYSTGQELNAESRRFRILFRRPVWTNQVLAAGRIVGVPGDSVEIDKGQLKINGRLWSEPYLVNEFRSNKSLPMLRLGNSEYAVLPENRNMLEASQIEAVVKRDTIIGRIMIRKWPFGWWLFRQNIFLQAQQNRANTE